MKRQLPDGTYRWLGVGRARPKGEAIATPPAPRVSTMIPNNDGGRKVAARAALS